MVNNPVQTDVFEGPLDLLLSLITKNEIDIYDIPIAEITEQYMAYIYRMNELDIELASEFVVMAAQLIEIKSKMMLPAEETEEEEWVDPREELMKRLLEYKVFKQISGYLKDHEQSYAETVTKDPEYYPDLQSDYSAVEIDGSVLEEALRRLLAEYEIKQEQEATQHYHYVSENVSVTDRMLDISRLLDGQNNLSFFSLFEETRSPANVVATFLAVLELMKRNIVRLEQDRMFGDISLKKIQVD